MEASIIPYSKSWKEEQANRLKKFVQEYAEKRNWRAITRLIGGSPRYDLQDYEDADAGEAPKGANW